MTKKVGRPPRKFSELEIQQLKKLAPKLNKAQLADFFSISPTTLREIEKRQPEVSDVYKKARAERIAEVVDQLFNLCMQGNITAICFFLKTQASWSEDTPEVTDIPAMLIELTTDATNKTAV
jgi:hypothetical protein